MLESANIFSSFGIDWKLFLAQVVNFLILVLVLRKFAYGPLIKLMRDRKTRIEEGLIYTEEAEKRLKDIEVEKLAVIKMAKNDAFFIVAEAEKNARKKKEEIVKQTIKKNEEIVADAKRLINEEKEKMAEVVYKNAEEFISLGVEKVLAGTTSLDRDKHLIEEAIKQLREINSK